MKPIALGGIAASDVEAFLQYLRVQLNAAGHWKEASTSSARGKRIWEVLWTPTAPGCRNCEITLTLTRRADGTLEPLQAQATGDVPDGWTHQVQRVADNALAATESKTESRFPLRFTLSYFGPPMRGEYHLPGFRVAPAVLEDPNLFPEERVVFLDLEEGGADIEDAHARAKVRVDKIAALLSVFADVGISLINGEKQERRWVDLGGNNCEKRWVRFAGRSPKIDHIPVMEEECQTGPFSSVDRGVRASIEALLTSYVGPREFLILPDDVHTLLKAFDELPSTKRTVYEGAAVLYRIAHSGGRHHPSVEMAYRVAAVEALAPHARKKTKAVGKLVRTLCPEAPRGEGQRIYRAIRCSHFHAGELPGGEYEPASFGPFTTGKRMGYRVQRCYIRAVTHSVLTRWLLHEAGAWP